VHTGIEYVSGSRCYIHDDDGEAIKRAVMPMGEGDHRNIQPKKVKRDRTMGTIIQRQQQSILDFIHQQVQPFLFSVIVIGITDKQ
jgi:hypothetical protein